MHKSEFQVTGDNPNALFTLKLHRGDGMTLIAMNWKDEKPPLDFVGFAIEYKEPQGVKFYPVKNRIAFPGADGKTNTAILSSLFSPIQKFRWVHFPRNADLKGEFIYRVSPVFMNSKDELSYGEQQQAAIVLQRDTYPRQLNIAFTRGFVSSQAFVDNFDTKGSPVSSLLPASASGGLEFKPTGKNAEKALAWMGFEARSAIFNLLDAAIADKTAQVSAIAYDLNDPEIVSRFEQLGTRLKIIIDDSGTHGESASSETKAAARLIKTAGADNVKREHMGNLQHNKIIVVDGKKIRSVVCGSTNFSWRGLYVQSNNAIVLNGKKAIKPFQDAFKNFWNFNTVADFSATVSSGWIDLQLTNINAKVSFSPHSDANHLLDNIADDITKNATSSVLYSLAFLYETTGSIRTAIETITKSNDVFVYGISDKKVGGIQVQKPNGNVEPVYPSALSKNLPEPFKSEPTGGEGTRMHHKFVVIDFDKPSARVYMGSYNFSPTADTKNGENLLLIKDKKVAVSYMIQALTIFDHYHFRVTVQEAKKANKAVVLVKPPRAAGEKPWWYDYYNDAVKIKDRILFS